jgi:hypothetical protein
MGHALGWPHSSGPYGEVYDSRWDVMSSAASGTALYGRVPIHTIATHKHDVGWIPEHRVWRPVRNASETRLVARSALPGGDGALMAETAITDTSAYTVESRIHAGYDQELPAEAVLIHRRGFHQAYVVDPDGNGEPNDLGAAWTPGETFEDEDIGLAVAVLERRGDDGFLVRITRSDEGLCTLSLSAEGGGKAVVTAGGPSLRCGKEARATAFADTDWRFEGWYRDGNRVSSAIEYWLPLDSSIHLAARFVEEPGCAIALSTYPDGAGTAEVVEGGETGPCGRPVAVRATPASGWSVAGWHDGSFLFGVFEKQYSFIASTSRTLRAEFEPGCRVEALVANQPGSVAFRDGSEIGPCGRTVTLEAIPGPERRFERWLGGGETLSTDPTYTFQADTQLIVLAVFAPSCDVDLTSRPDGAGILAVVPGGPKGDCGRTVTVAATPSEGWVFLEWTEDGVARTTRRTFLLTASTSRAFEASFTPAFALATRVRTIFLGGEAEISAQERGALDRIGNGDGSLDLGELLALFDLLPGAQAAELSLSPGRLP